MISPILMNVLPVMYILRIHVKTFTKTLNLQEDVSFNNKYSSTIVDESVDLYEMVECEILSGLSLSKSA